MILLSLMIERAFRYTSSAGLVSVTTIARADNGRKSHLASSGPEGDVCNSPCSLGESRLHFPEMRFVGADYTIRTLKKVIRTQASSVAFSENYKPGGNNESESLTNIELEQFITTKK
jgi:hypothetical protein